MPLICLPNLSPGTKLSCLLIWSGSGTSGEFMVRMLGIHRVSSLWQTKNSDCACGIMVPVQDGSGIEICSAICTCVNRWIL